LRIYRQNHNMDELCDSLLNFVSTKRSLQNKNDEESVSERSSLVIWVLKLLSKQFLSSKLRRSIRTTFRTRFSWIISLIEGTEEGVIEVIKYRVLDAVVVALITLFISKFKRTEPYLSWLTE
jgi:hypothetical protein